MPPAPVKKLLKPRRYLPADYVPHESDVLIGRGRLVETHNKKFRAMISAHLAAYYNAQTKATKSTIILRIFQTVKRGGGTGFIKREASSKKFYVVEDASARISIAQAFRDALSSEYKSSKQYKQQKRKEERGEGTLGHMIMGLVPNETPQEQLFSTSTSSSLIPPRLIPVVSSDGTDLSSSRSSLQSILQQATNVVTAIDAESMLRNSPEALSPSRLIQDSQDILAGLEQAIGSQIDLTSNPFEPTPLKETSSPEQDEVDLFQVFDAVPALDIRQALSV